MEKIPSLKYPQGLTIIIENIFSLHDLAKTLFNEGHIRVSFVLAFTAWEEIGKADMLLDYWHKESITRKEWTSSRLFRGHLKKIQKARIRLGNEIVDALIKTNPELNPDGNPIKVHMNVRNLKNYEKIRNHCLHVGYDFKNQEWISPSKLNNLTTLTKGMISEIKAALNALIYRMRLEYKIKDYEYVQ